MTTIGEPTIDDKIAELMERAKEQQERAQRFKIAALDADGLGDAMKYVREETKKAGKMRLERDGFVFEDTHLPLQELEKIPRDRLSDAQRERL